MPVDVRAIGCDFLAFSGHKMAGVTGIGVLYGRRALLDAMPPWQGGGGMISNVDFFESRWKPSPERFEAGTPNFGDAVALGAACDFLDALGPRAIREHDGAPGPDRLRAPGGAARHPPASGPEGERGGLVSFAFEDVHAHDVVTFADEDGIALRGGHHCNQPLMKKARAHQHRPRELLRLQRGEGNRRPRGLDAPHPRLFRRPGLSLVLCRAKPYDESS